MISKINAWSSEYYLVLMLVLIGALLFFVAWLMVSQSQTGTTTVTGQVDKLWQEAAWKGQTDDYVRVVLPGGIKKAWYARPTIWGLLENGQVCTFQVLEDKEVISANCGVQTQ